MSAQDIQQSKTWWEQGDFDAISSFWRQVEAPPVLALTGEHAGVTLRVYTTGQPRKLVRHTRPCKLYSIERATQLWLVWSRRDPALYHVELLVPSPSLSAPTSFMMPGALTKGLATPFVQGFFERVHASCDEALDEDYNFESMCDRLNLVY